MPLKRRQLDEDRFHRNTIRKLRIFYKSSSLAPSWVLSWEAAGRQVANATRRTGLLRIYFGVDSHRRIDIAADQRNPRRTAHRVSLNFPRNPQAAGAGFGARWPRYRCGQNGP